jgi:hypothetical protein
MPTPQTLPDLVKILINHLEGISNHLQFQSAKLTEIADTQREALDHLKSLDVNIDGFTDSGANLRTFQVDQYTTGFLSLLGPLLSVRLNKELGSRSIPDLIKACAPLTRDALEEMGAYRQAQAGRDLLANTAGTMGDARTEPAPDPSSDWNDLDRQPFTPPSQ